MLNYEYLDYLDEQMVDQPSPLEQLTDEIAEIDNKQIFKGIFGSNNIVSYSLTSRFQRAMEQLHEIMEEHKSLLNKSPDIVLLLNRLLTLFREANIDNTPIMNEANSLGEKTLLEVLDRLDDMSFSIGMLDKANEYAELELQLTDFYREYY